MAALLAATTVMAPKAEPLGSGDDRVATRMEDAIKAAPEPWLACWAAHGEGHDEIARAMVTRVRLRSGTGAVRKVQITHATGSRALDECATDLVKRLVVEPPPTFGDRIELVVVWQLPQPEDQK